VKGENTNLGGDATQLALEKERKIVQKLHHGTTMLKKPVARKKEGGKHGDENEAIVWL